MTYKNTNKRDGNEKEIIAFFIKAGASMVQGSIGQGYDLLVLYRGLLHVVEIKMPSERKHLTESEKSLKHMAESHGIAYNVITSVEEAAEMIGAAIC